MVVGSKKRAAVSWVNWQPESKFSRFTNSLPANTAVHIRGRVSLTDPTFGPPELSFKENSDFAKRKLTLARLGWTDPSKRSPLIFRMVGDETSKPIGTRKL